MTPGGVFMFVCKAKPLVRVLACGKAKLKLS